MGSFTCKGDGHTILAHNAYYTASGSVKECGMPLVDWQAQGGDVGSTVGPYPTDDEIISWAKAKLGF